MCITTGPSSQSQTILLAHSIKHPDNGREVNVIGYKNKGESRGPCAMLLPIPSATPMTAANCLNLSDCPTLFKQYAELVTPRSRGLTLSMDDICFGVRSVEIFESGSYTVLLAKRASDIPAVLGSVPESKRPAVNPDLYAAMDDLYPEFWFALCCWSGVIDAEPLLWWYDPLPAYTTHHFLPALDAHTGGVPKLDTHVDVDHTIVLGMPADGPDAGRFAEDIRDQAPETLRKFLPSHVTGTKLETDLPNGDWRIAKNKRPGYREFLNRVSPPGAITAHLAV